MLPDACHEELAMGNNLSAGIVLGHPQGPNHRLPHPLVEGFVRMDGAGHHMAHQSSIIRATQNIEGTVAYDWQFQRGATTQNSLN